MDIGKKEPAHIPIYLFIALVLFAVRHEFSQDSLLFLPAVIFPGAVEQVDIGNVPLCFGVAGYSGAEEKDDGDGKNPFFLLSLLAGLGTIYSQGAVGAIKEYAGESLAVSLMISLKVYWDYVVCLIFPFQPSPRYFFNGVFLKDPQFILA